MCGIMGYNGSKNAIPIVIKGLKSLEYRGYDSAGIAYFFNEKIKIIKEKGRISELEKLLSNDNSNLCIGHTRWATHGKPSKINAHPHMVGRVTLVHNGIIENYKELKDNLEKEGYSFKSETDTEIACSLIDSIYKKNNDILETLEQIQTILKGSYAFLIIFQQDKNIYALRKGSPLVLTENELGTFVASDIPAILEYSKKFYFLEEGEVAKLSKESITFYSKKNIINKKYNTFNYDLTTAKKNGYSHFMLKEIYEQPKVVKEFLDYYFENFKLIPDISKYKKIQIVACGSAYHSGLVGSYFIEKYGHIEVQSYVASEYRYKEKFIDKDTLVILVSQSGETADTIASLRLAKEYQATTLGIVNVIGSTIARECDEVIYINAGCEIAVATTKAYTLQVLTFSLIAYKLGVIKGNIDNNLEDKIKNDYLKLPQYIDDLLKLDYNNLTNKTYSKKNVFFIGRQLDYYSCLEGSLKLKEISYIHSESYPAGELKHGTISLIEEKTPVVSIVTDEKICEKSISNIKEVKSRGAYVLLVKKSNILVDDSAYDDKIEIPNTFDLVSSILTIIPLQMLAFNVSFKLGLDIDKPRNLAKSVTVE